jgi:hypothetical protein
MATVTELFFCDQAQTRQEALAGWWNILYAQNQTELNCRKVPEPLIAPALLDGF